MVNGNEEQTENRPNEQALPHAAQGPGPAAALRRPFERRLDDLEFAHTLCQTCRRRASLASAKWLDRTGEETFCQGCAHADRPTLITGNELAAQPS